MKVFTEAFVSDLLKQVTKEEISFSRMVELLNEYNDSGNAIWVNAYSTKNGKIILGGNNTYNTKEEAITAHTEYNRSNKYLGAFIIEL